MVIELKVENSTTPKTQVSMAISRRHLLFAAACLALALINMRTLLQLLEHSLKHEFASFIPIMPFMSAALIFRKRKSIFKSAHGTPVLGIAAMLLGSVLLIWAAFGNLRSLDQNALSIKAAGIIILVLGAFLFAYGWGSFKDALFPLLLLLFMIPIPEVWIAKAVHILQQGSAEGVDILLSLTGTPHQWQGLAFVLPRVTIEIAPECSSIRSSLALLISCLLAGHLVLRTTSRKFAFVLMAIPMAMLKNAIRIVVLSLLAIHVDMGYLSGDLHHKGGIVFFILTLLLMWPVLWILRKSEKTSRIARINE
jgi:exosortase